MLTLIITTLCLLILLVMAIYFCAQNINCYVQSVIRKKPDMENLTISLALLLGSMGLYESFVSCLKALLHA